jgi:translation initiation factor 2 alpha subunit (eIF-2alpha)
MREIKEVGPDGKEVTKVVPAVTEEVKEALVMNIKRRMTPQPLKIRADIEMKCFQFDGVIHIKVLIISDFLFPYIFQSICYVGFYHTIIWFCRRQCGRLKLLEMMIAL